jgi:hypothetical protein
MFESLLQGMPPVDMPEPIQINGKAGDAVLVHYQIAHGAAPNVSPHTRYACFYRLTRIDHELYPPMTNIWMDWPGIREIFEDK